MFLKQSERRYRDDQKNVSLFGVLSCLLGVLFCLPVMADEAPPEASVNGKYSELIQVLPVPEIAAVMANFATMGIGGRRLVR
jgi:putative lipase involved disintegration of autophagic bodies